MMIATELCLLAQIVWFGTVGMTIPMPLPLNVGDVRMACPVKAIEKLSKLMLPFRQTKLQPLEKDPFRVANLVVWNVTTLTVSQLLQSPSQKVFLKCKAIENTLVPMQE